METGEGEQVEDMKSEMKGDAVVGGMKGVFIDVVVY
jgi:hypothetical protein